MSEPIFDVVKEMCSSPITISSSYKVKDYDVKLVWCGINYRNILMSNYYIRLLAKEIL